MIKFDDFAEYSVKAVPGFYDYGPGGQETPHLILTHSTCKQEVMDEYLSVSLIHVMQRALNHSRECDA